MWMSDELEAVPHYETIWWDFDKSCEFFGSPTGTPTQPYPNVKQRTVRRAYPKMVHKNCGGDVRVTNKDCGNLKVGLVCETCGKEICAEY